MLLALIYSAVFYFQSSFAPPLNFEIKLYLKVEKTSRTLHRLINVLNKFTEGNLGKKSAFTKKLTLLSYKSNKLNSLLSLFTQTQRGSSFVLFIKSQTLIKIK